jgi:chromosome segregation ATPase
MKKIMAMLMLAMLFLGLMPFATAQQGSGSGTQDSENMQVDSARSGQLEPMLLRNGSGAEGAMPQRALEMERVQLRQIASSRLQAARQRFETARNRYQTAKQNYANAKARITQTRARYNECKGEETAECTQVRKETKSNARSLLVNGADRVIASLEKLKEKIELSDRLTYEEAAERIAEIDAKIAELQEAKETSEDLDEESDPEDVREAANQIRNAWQNTKRVMQINAARVVNAKIGGVIVKSEKLQERLGSAVAKLSEEGQDTAEVEALIDEFSAKVESAKTHYELAMDKHEEARATEGDVSDIMKEATSHMQEAHKELKEAHAVLAKVLRQMKSTRAGQQALEEAEEEEVE